MDFLSILLQEENPTKGSDRAKKNVEEGKGVSLGGFR